MDDAMVCIIYTQTTASCCRDPSYADVLSGGVFLMPLFENELRSWISGVTLPMINCTRSGVRQNKKNNMDEVGIDHRFCVFAISYKCITEIRKAYNNNEPCETNVGMNRLRITSTTDLMLFEGAHKHVMTVITAQLN